MINHGCISRKGMYFIKSIIDPRVFGARWNCFGVTTDNELFELVFHPATIIDTIEGRSVRFGTDSTAIFYSHKRPYKFTVNHDYIVEMTEELKQLIFLWRLTNTNL